jgi:hypothetical protein
MKELPPVSPVLWRQRYEALRQHVVGSRQILGSEPLGLVVLFARGLAGWMQSWWETPAEQSWPPALPPAPRCPSTPQWQRQLTDVLAHMAAQHL